MFLLQSEDEEVVKSAVKGLTACTQTNETARNTLVWECKGKARNTLVWEYREVRLGVCYWGR